MLTQHWVLLLKNFDFVMIQSMQFYVIGKSHFCITFSWCSMRISTTMFWNLRSMMAATVSSCGLIKVGPNTTPRLATVIRFCLLCAATLRNTTIHYKHFSPKSQLNFTNTKYKKGRKSGSTTSKYLYIASLDLVGKWRHELWWHSLRHQINGIVFEKLPLMNGNDYFKM